MGEHGEMIRYVTETLAAAADPERAVRMQAYMRTEMPFYGVQKPGRVPILRHVLTNFPPEDRARYEDMVLALWSLPHREEKYLALGLAAGHRRYVVPESLPLYKRLIAGGAWWDLVDEVATHLVRHLVLNHAETTWPEIDTWIDDDDMWLRRSAIICQVGAKGGTDAGRLFDFCTRRATEHEFFIRKAIGWALREYAKTDPEAVAGFVATQPELSGLSRREALRNL